MGNKLIEQAKEKNKMKRCKTCKSKMPVELFVGEDCPICSNTWRNLKHGLPLMTPFQGEKAQQMVEDAWQYYRPVGDDIYGLKHN